MAKRGKAAKPLQMGPEPGQKPVTRGDRVKALRLAKGWSQAELAYRAEIAERQVREVEGGKIDLQLRGFRRLCIALETSADFLLGLDE